MDHATNERTGHLLKPVHHTTCRICQSALLPILSLGEQYLSDFPASAGTKAYPPVPLDLVRCENPRCGLVQLAYTTPGEWLYSQYWYRSGVNESMRLELEDVIRGGLRFVETDRHLMLADIGANDGTLLSLYPKVLAETYPQCTGFLRVAWEPAKNLYEACRPHAEVLFPGFFAASADEWKGQIHLLTSIAMFYDLEDPHRFVGDVCNLLHKTGVWVIQQAYLPDMLDASGYDNIGHEHLEYYSLGPLEALLGSHGLEVFHVEHRAINGGSFRTYVGWKDRHPVDPSVARMRQVEEPLRRRPEMIWATFTLNVRTRIEELRAGIGALVQAGKSVDIYGASTKGNTLLQTCGIDARTIRQAWERSPEKWGRHVGVSGIPIVPEAEGRADPPAALLVLPWGFKDSFVAREQEYLFKGGKLIFPLPTVEVVGG